MSSIYNVLTGLELALYMAGDEPAVRPPFRSRADYGPRIGKLCGVGGGYERSLVPRRQRNRLQPELRLRRLRRRQPHHLDLRPQGLHRICRSQTVGPVVNATARSRLTALLGERATMVADILAQHGRGEAYHRDSPPDMVVFPTSTEEVSAIAAVCSQYDVAMIPFGAGTSLEGNVLALEGGVCIDFSAGPCQRGDAVGRRLELRRATQRPDGLPRE